MPIVSKAEFGITPYDDDLLKKLRIGQRLGLATSQLVLLSGTEETVTYTTLRDLIGEMRKEEILIAWDRVTALSPSVSLADFARLWYDTASPKQKAAPGFLREDPLLTEIRELYLAHQNHAGPYQTLNFLASDVQDYLERIELQVTDEAEELRTHGAVIDQLVQLPIADISAPEYEFVTRILTVQSDFTPLDLYDQLLLDPNLPFAGYNGATDQAIQFYKLYRSEGPYDLEWLVTNVVDRCLNFRLYTGPLDQSPTTPAQFTPVTYQWGLEPARVQLAVPFVEGFTAAEAERRLMDRLSPFLTITDRLDTNVKGVIKVRDFTFREDVLAELVMNESLFAHYLYIRETSLFVVTNRRPTYHMRLNGEERLVFRIENRESRVNESFLSPSGTIEYMEDSTPYTAITFEATSAAVVENFVQIMGHLFTAYQRLEGKILDLYQALIPGYGAVFSALPSSIVGNDTAIKRLEHAAPEIFKFNYARTCQGGDRQPIILSPEEAVEWTKQTFTYKDRTFNRTVLQFPIHGEAPTRIYACPNNNNPFPSLITNNKGNKARFPLVPCCYGSPDEIEKVGGNYGVYYRGEAPKVANTKSRSVTVIETNKFAGPGYFGGLPRAIDFLLNYYQPGEWYRAGTVFSPNSLLHAVAMARDPTYASLTTSEEKEEYVRTGLKPRLFTAPALLRQEITAEELATLTAPDSYLDSRIFFRAVEELFQINLVIFTLTEEDKSGTLEQPRSTGISYRPYLSPTRPTVVVYKHSGGEANLGDYPQTELIIRYDEVQEQNSPVPTDSLVLALMEAVAAVTRADSWSYGPEGKLIHDPQANVVLDLSSLFDSVETQYLDQRGKLRAFVSAGITILPPLNRPFGVSTVKESELPLAKLEQVLDLVQDLRTRGVDAWLYATNLSSEGMLIGVWWYIGAPTPKSLFFCPVEMTPFDSRLASLQVNYLPYPAFDGSEESSRSRYQQLARTKYFLLELVQYLILIEEYQVGEFLDRFTVIRPGHQYDPSGVSQYFPTGVETVPAALAALVAPTFVEDGKLILDSAALKEKLYSFLYVFVGKVVGLPATLPTAMRNYYQVAADFTPRPDQLVFDNLRRAQDWIRDSQVQQLGTTVTTSITPNHETTRLPYVLALPSGFFLIQNVLDGSLSRARQLSETWVTEAVNAGYYVTPTGTAVTSLYQALPSGEVELVESLSDSYLLRYPSGAYAAMLFLSP